MVPSTAPHPAGPAPRALFCSAQEPRLYQQVIGSVAVARNTLVVLPTGMGKTLIAELVASHRLAVYPGTKVLLVAPTRPLAQQHLDTFRRDFTLPDEGFALLTGNVPPAKRALLWARATFLFATPQGIENDLLSRRVGLADVSLLIVDEAHRAVGDYAYVFLAERYRQEARHERLLALTASPGGDKESIEEVCRNLAIEGIEARSAESPDVEPYIQELEVRHVKVRMPEQFTGVHGALSRCYARRIDELALLGLNRQALATKRGLLAAQASLHAQTARGLKDPSTFRSISVLAEALKVQHALELLETQGLVPLRKYVEKLRRESSSGQSKAVRRLFEDLEFKTALTLLDRLEEDAVDHPKLRAVQKAVLQELYAERTAKVIIFTQYRDQATRIKELLDAINVSAKVFVGQMKKGDTGMSQKEQRAILDEFRNGGFSVLIATSVAEEGLDIPKVDAVIFYEPVPSAIRTVQRRGRTGRLEKGRVIMLVTEGTRDVAHKFAAHHKEKRMYRVLTEVRRDLEAKRFIQKEPRSRDGILAAEGVMAERAEEGADAARDVAQGAGIAHGARDAERVLSPLPRIVADHREKGSPVLKTLLANNVPLSLEHLSVGDYLLSDRVVVEYKRVPDFVDSIVDGRLLDQLRGLRRYPRPLIIVEGKEDLYSVRKVHPNAILGMFAAITVSYNIPVIFTATPEETARFLLLVAKKEAARGGKPVYYGQKPLALTALQESIVSSLPGVGPASAKRLLARFLSVKGVVNASAEELTAVERLGRKRAGELVALFEERYDPSK